MSDETIKALIANLPSILVAFGTLATSLIGAVIAIFTFRRAGRAETAAVTATVMAEASVEQSKLNTTKIEEASGQIETVRLDVNDKMQQFIEVTKTSAKAEGKLEEKDEQAVRDADAPKALIVEDIVKVELVDPLKKVRETPEV